MCAAYAIDFVAYASSIKFVWCGVACFGVVCALVLVVVVVVVVSTLLNLLNERMRTNATDDL